jgi:hypothetical protein
MVKIKSAGEKGGSFESDCWAEDWVEALGIKGK